MTAQRKVEPKSELMGPLRKLDLNNGMGSIFYRIPNCIEQLRFFSQSGWYREDIMKDGMLRISAGLEAAREYVVRVEGAVQSIDEVIDDRDNMDCLIDFVNDIAGVKKRVTEDEKKL